jgi:hypothetical protein
LVETSFLFTAPDALLSSDTGSTNAKYNYNYLPH